jgi:predicted 3-demethylubiquinone-9 3-methyltransferase (glyoxalase superfamily)/uncharacterized protein YndB with AHSA1/START domain
MNRPLEIVADPAAPTILTRRWFAAPVELVWEAWTRPELARRWMGPRALQCVSYEIDLRVGGGYRFVHRAPDGQEFAFHGVYREIERPRRLVSTFVFEAWPDVEVVDTLTLEAQGGGTLATTLSVHPSFEARDGHLQSGMEEGMSDGYQRLDELLPELAAGRQRALPFLWFRSEAAEAAQRYVQVLGGRIVDTMRMGDAVMACTFEVRGLRVVALNGNQDQPFTDAFSLQIPCDTQAEIDALWEGLLDGGGKETACGWLRDRWGVSWQIVPSALPELLSRPGAVQRMMGMKKLDIAGLRGE